MRGVGEGVAHGEEGGRRFVVGIEGERALRAVGPFLAVGLAAVEPGVLVGESPGEDGFDGLVFEGYGEVVAINVGNGLIAGGGVGGGVCCAGDGVVVDVEFGQVDIEAQGLGATDEIAEAFAPGLAVAGGDVRLDAEGVDGDVGGFEAFEEIERGGALGLIGFAFVFDAVLVVGEFGVGIGVARGAVGELEIFRPDELKPGAFAERVGTAVEWVDGFIDDVPALDFAFVARGDGVDVVGEDLFRVVFGDCASEPGGELLVPDEVVAADFYVVLVGEVDEGVGIGEVVLAGLG